MRSPKVPPKQRAESPNQQLKRGPWTADEDKILKDYVKKNGDCNWNMVAKNSGLQRTGKSCRLRWMNNLRPNLNKGYFSLEEEILILQLQAEYGNKWAHMTKYLPGRTDNDIKNHWNTRCNQIKRAGSPPNSLPAVDNDRNRAKNICFQFPYLTSPVQNELENSVMKELPSSQFFSSSNSGLLSDVFQESQRERKLLTSTCFANLLGIKVMEEMFCSSAKTVVPDLYNNFSCGGENLKSDEEIVGMDWSGIFEWIGSCFWDMI